ncbi:angiotensin-converting enzyme-like isoform X2 [Centruroides vittatus]|uniref:angiotensin-converting enzyme-like isoform X2 n=1 Tax=Centruroides vittatus TaxID=120091 RepID=UPI00350EAB99
MLSAFLLYLSSINCCKYLITEEQIASRFIRNVNEINERQCHLFQLASWNYETNITKYNKNKMVKQEMINSKITKENWKKLMKFDWRHFSDPQLRRQFRHLSHLGDEALSVTKLRKKESLEADMVDIYSTTVICDFKNKTKCNLALDPDLTNILAKSNNYEELKHVWKEWRNKVGRKIKPLYWKFVDLSNEVALLNGFKDAGEFQRDRYESPTFLQDLENLWKQIQPLYQQLHAYVRRKLIQKYGKDKIKDDGPIPAHLFGNMWSQEWQNILNLVIPYRNKPSLDVTPQMKAKKMKPIQIAKLAEEFFVSLGLRPMTKEFWNNSLFEKPKDRKVVCHASAWDLCNKNDFRIKLCMEPTMEFLITTHHEMGHVQYYMQYAKQPHIFRTGANPGFHEAIGDVMGLSVYTPNHLQSMGLLNDIISDRESDINFLMEMALKKVAFLPFGYILDKWRWEVYSGEIPLEEWNKGWWEMRFKYQGICPPVMRTEIDFDPGAKFHVPANTPYIRYFISFIIQFQFHEALCRVSGYQGPLHKCDIYNSKEAGKLISEMMQMGSSRPWPEALEKLTGTRKMNAHSLLEYFKPLYEWLKETNKEEIIGWETIDPNVCP